MKPQRQPTPFQMKVYEATSRIPRGKVATYGWVARQIGCKSAQAVGGALRVNPFAPQVPCHRVVASDGSLHGFAGHTSGPLLKKKLRLLKEEGVEFDAPGRVLPEFLLARQDNGHTDEDRTLVEVEDATHTCSVTRP